MKTKGYKNNHFVSQSFTKPWEINTKRELAYYDFSRKRIDIKPSRRLLSKRKVFTPKMEIRFKHLIEDPIGIIRNRLRRNGIFKINTWSENRALYLYFLAQAPRFFHAVGRSKATEFSKLLEKSDDELDVIVVGMMEDSQLLYVASENPLFFPSTGVFYFLTEDHGCETEYSLVRAFPFGPNSLVCMTSKSVESNKIDIASLWSYTIGLNDLTDKVVIPPKVYSRETEANIRRNVRRARRLNRIQVTLIRRSRKCAIEVASSLGIKLEAAYGFHDKIIRRK